MKTISFTPNPQSEAKVTGYLHDESPTMPERNQRPCVLIFPGGGYDHLSPRESDPPALAFFARGYQVFLLFYSIREQASGMRPLTDAVLTIAAIRKHHAEWNVFPGQIAVCGFSAGGHLAACLATLRSNPTLMQQIGGIGEKSRPDAIILGYPVISPAIFPGNRIFALITGSHPEKTEYYSTEKYVTNETPPAFLWHTADDQGVSVENTFLFAAALQKNHVPFECHIYPSGGHGQSMCSAEVGRPNPHCATWFGLCVQWLDNLFQFQY